MWHHESGDLVSGDDAVEVLAESAIFRGFSREVLASINAVATERRVRAGGAVFREGEPAELFCVVISGRLKLTQVGADGNEVILRFVGPGEAAAALALFAEAVYPVTATAVRQSRLLIWPQEALQALVQRHATLAANLLRLVSERLREVQERFRELATERVAQRIARALVRLVRQAGRKVEAGVLIDMPLSRRDLAELTGTTLFTVSRVLSAWEAEGIVASRRQRVVVCSPHALVAIAEDLPEPVRPERQPR
jgi:CRP-like cAMP-binding protein